MQEVIDELLKTEADAQETISRARDETQQEAARVEADCSAKLNEERENSRRRLVAEVEKTREALQAENAEALRRAQAKADTLWTDNRKAIDELMDDVIALISTPEYEKEKV